MNYLNPIIYAVINVAFVLIISPFFISLIKKVKAFCQGRKGPSLFQSYYNLIKLFKKESVYSTSSSGIMRISPYINIILVLAATICVPLFLIPQSSDLGNIILFLYLLAMARFFMALSGLDAGSTFGGMGSSREMTIAAIFEPVTIIVFAALAFILKTTNIYDMFQATSGSSIIPNPTIVLISMALFILLIVETARIPVDNPETHLELTMIHEAMILEQSGKNLALMELSHAIKQTLIMALLINIIFPLGITSQMSFLAITIGGVLFFIKAAILGISVGIFESYLAKFRLFRLPNLFMIAFFLASLTILVQVFI